jgi:hypothetical protein
VFRATKSQVPAKKRTKDRGIDTDRVSNRGVPPTRWLKELIAWAKKAPDEIFEPNDKKDAYWSVAKEMGPYTTLKYRKAVMCEILRVLAGFESSWRWTEGVDKTNPTSNTPCTEETGCFQVSGNSMNFDQSLKDLVLKKVGTLDCKAFIPAMKSDHELALEYAARLLRFTVKHNGPVLRKEINPYLNKSAVAEFEKLLG